MLWLPDVQALEAGMTRPFKPKRTPTFAAVVWGIMRRYVVALMFPNSPLVSIMPKSRTASVLPVDEPYATPIAPVLISGASRSPASLSASSLAQVASNATRPIERVTLRL